MLKPIACSQLILNRRYSGGKLWPVPYLWRVGGFFENSFGWWSTDSNQAYFVDVDRYYKYARVVEFRYAHRCHKNSV